MKINQNLSSTDSLTSLINSKGIKIWDDLLEYTKQLPYGRNRNRTDLSLVIIEEKGSCSSKHAFLKKVADLNNITNIKLILGMYKMNEQNTPKIGNLLTENNIPFIPEAHCYLKIKSERKDITSENSNFSSIENDILTEIEITPQQVVDFKVQYHQQFLKKWILKNNIHYNFDDLWKIREQCIFNLSK